MNGTTWTVYREYLDKVGEPAAAASLALADTIQQQMDGKAAPADQPMTVPEVARILRVRRNKVLAWIKTSALKAVNITERVGGRPKYRIRRDDLDAFLTLRNTVQAVKLGRPKDAPTQAKSLPWPSLGRATHARSP